MARLRTTVGNPATPYVGAVVVLYGSANRLTSTGRQLLYASDLAVVPQQEDALFGFSLSAGTFNGGSYDDLAIGIPFQDVSGVTDVGAVAVVYGSANKLKTTAGGLGPQLWTLENLSLDADPYDSFGTRLTAATH